MTSNSVNGFMTSIWGPMLWSILHMISLNYPDNPTDIQKINYYIFIISLTKVLPCKTCRINLEKNINTLDFSIEKDMQNRKTFSKFIYKLHCEVNTMLSKSVIYQPSYQEMCNTYELFRAKCNVLSKKNDHIGCFQPDSKSIVKPKCIINIVPFKETSNSLIVSDDCFC